MVLTDTFSASWCDVHTLDLHHAAKRNTSLFFRRERMEEQTQSYISRWSGYIACRRHIATRAILCSLLANHSDSMMVVDFNCHISTTQRTQPKIFKRGGPTCAFQISSRLGCG